MHKATILTVNMHPAVSSLLATLMLGGVVVAGVNADDAKHGISFNNTPCVYPTANEEFAAAFYSSMVVTVGAENLKKFVLPGTTVAFQEFEIVTDILSDLCNAGEVGYLAARGIALEPTKTLKRYIKETAFAVADFLYDQKKLRCDNAVTLGLRLFKDAKDGFKGLDLKQFKSYQRGIDIGILKFVTELGYELKDIIENLAGVFDQEYVLENHDGCPVMMPKSLPEAQ